MTKKVETATPIADAIVIRKAGRADRLVVLRCPFCDERHYHGGGDEPISRERLYHRVADCQGGGYAIRVIEPPRQSAHKAEARASIAFGPAIALW